MAKIHKTCALHQVTDGFGMNDIKWHQSILHMSEAEYSIISQLLSVWTKNEATGCTPALCARSEATCSVTYRGARVTDSATYRRARGTDSAAYHQARVSSTGPSITDKSPEVS